MRWKEGGTPLLKTLISLLQGSEAVVLINIPVEIRVRAVQTAEVETDADSASHG